MMKTMELCQDCLDMIIEAETRIKNKKVGETIWQ